VHRAAPRAAQPDGAVLHIERSIYAHDGSLIEPFLQMWLSLYQMYRFLLVVSPSTLQHNIGPKNGLFRSTEQSQK
jgi:hypothetical protein